jgi:hypothetical protein
MRDIAMKTGRRYSIRAILGGLRRKPVLVAMMVTSLIYGVTASIAGIAVWKASSECATAQSSTGPNVARVALDVAGMDGKSTPAGEAVSVACPCAVSKEWHWQRI